MHIQKIQIKNFKAFQDVTINLNSDVNIFTGKNNSGKTTILEAVALWHECFNKLIDQYETTATNYVSFSEVNSVRIPNCEDIFYQQKKLNKIEIIVLLKREETSFNIGFEIASSGSIYVIRVLNSSSHDFEEFRNTHFHIPFPIGLYYASPVSIIRQQERFVTNPQILESIQIRESVSVIRNRLYSLYYNQQDLSLYQSFLTDLSYVLFDNREKINFYIESDIRQETKVIINFTIHPRDTEKDLSLLGSGTLQIIEILLNLYSSERITAFDLILLDEPDSHIHYDIQKRLLSILTRFSQQRNQLLITTHNEALIRSSDLHHLFHLENTANHVYQSLNNTQIQNLDPRFKGIYPMATNPIISSLGNTNGLDFINAIEADRIVFVEGQDDARAIYLLLQKGPSPRNTKKYVFWVLNGISHVFKEILSYKTVFSAIKNNKTLWEKSVLIIDRDFLSDEHCQIIKEKMQEKLGLESYITEAYTLEATLLTDLNKLGRLLTKWVNNTYSQNIDQSNLINSLESSYQSILQNLQTNYLDNDKWIEEATYRYRTVRDDLNIIFPKSKIIPFNDVRLTVFYRDYLKKAINNQEFFKITRKQEVENIINEVLQPYGITFDLEKDFINLLQMVDKSTWFEAWDFLLRL
jgi:predicted ATP-dependent endonuclease of OLD family